MTVLSDVRKASAKFYAALDSLARGDNAAMTRDVWFNGPGATAQHPVGPRHRSYKAVLESFAQVGKVATGGEVRLRDQEIDAGGDMAVETGTEVGSITIGGQKVNFELRVTNIYRRDGDSWKIFHHHADPSPAMAAAVDRVMKAHA